MRCKGLQTALNSYKNRAWQVGTEEGGRAVGGALNVRLRD